MTCLVDAQSYIVVSMIFLGGIILSSLWVVFVYGLRVKRWPPEWRPRLRFECRQPLSVDMTEAWVLIIDMAKWCRWTDSFVVDSPPSMPPTDGDEVRIRPHLAGISPLILGQLAGVTPGRVLSWRGRLPGLIGRHTLRLEPHEAGCELIHSEEVAGPLAPLVHTLGIWRRLRSRFEAFNQDLKCHVERLEERVNVEVDGASWSVWRVGEVGEPVVLLHGYMGSALTWRHQIYRLAEDHRVYAPDWLGVGLSDSLCGHCLDFDREVGRLGMLLDALGLDRVNLIGHDYGAYIGPAFASRYPERVLRLAAINGRAHRTFKWPWYVTLHAAHLIARVPLLGGLATRLPIRWIHERLILLGERRKGVLDRAALDMGLRWMARDYRSFISQYRTPVREELAKAVHLISCPTVVIWGTSDLFLSTCIGEDLADRIPKATFHPLDCGHFSVEECPEELLAILYELLARPHQSATLPEQK